MEVLRQSDHGGIGDLDEKGLEKRKQEAHKSFVKEKSLITIMHTQNLITIMHTQKVITIITTMEPIVAHHHAITLLIQIPIIVHLLHRIAIMDLTTIQRILLNQGLTIIQKFTTVLLRQNHITIIHLHHYITTMEVTTPHLRIIIPPIQKLPTTIPIQNLITIILLLLSTTMENTMVVYLIFLLTQKHSISLV
ncbi:hypothetical protein Q8A67_003448 [Cirrhinus molitorella]|uniref:Uncharacterized protein n=1 Tax=Cirrhinus molitorella TaxID=172907 RepID=A0AA88Q0M9_9TELE|nr:hypothetical protein Q8A67_003448 [Cirrhinus molitorella]